MGINNKVKASILVSTIGLGLSVGMGGAEASSILKGCRTDADGNRVCPEDLNLVASGILKGCKTDADGNRVCPEDMGMIEINGIPFVFELHKLA